MERLETLWGRGASLYHMHFNCSCSTCTQQLLFWLSCNMLCIAQSPALLLGTMGVVIELYIMIPTPNTKCVHSMTSTPDEGPCESQWQKTYNPMDAHKKNTTNQMTLLTKWKYWFAGLWCTRGEIWLSLMLVLLCMCWSAMCLWCDVIC